MNAPPMMPAAQHPASALRVVTGLLLFALLDLAVQIHNGIAWLKDGGTVSLTAPFSTLALGLAAWLVWRGHRGIWQALFYLAPIGFDLILGLVLASGLFLPWRLLRSLMLHGPESLTLSLAYLLLLGVLLAWLAWEAGRHRGPSGPRQFWSQPPVLAVWGALPSLLLAKLVLLLLQGSWTNEAVALARGQLGDAYDYQVISWHMQKQARQTTGHAVILAYNDHEMQQIQVRW